MNRIFLLVKRCRRYQCLQCLDTKSNNCLKRAVTIQAIRFPVSHLTTIFHISEDGKLEIRDKLDIARAVEPS